MERSRNRNLIIGVLGAVTAYLVWGLQPIYWKALAQLDAWVVLAHRYCWTAVFLIVFIGLTGQFALLCETTRQLFQKKSKLLLLILISFIALLNWWMTVFAPINGYVVELGIGQFLTPVMSVFLGVVFFREYLSFMQKISMLLALVGIFIMLIHFGQFPWIALGISSTWAAYGALKKKISLDPTIAIFLETIVVVPFAIVFLHATADSIFKVLETDLVLGLFLIGTGILTSAPLIAYTYATNCLPLSLLGFCQFISPMLTLCLGIFVYKEPFRINELLPLLFIWSSIVIFILDPIRGKLIAKKKYISNPSKRAF